MWQDDTAWLLWQDQWDKGDEYALNTLAVHCPKCPAKFVNNVRVRDGISRALAVPTAASSAMLRWAGQVGGAFSPSLRPPPPSHLLFKESKSLDTL